MLPFVLIHPIILWHILAQRLAPPKIIVVSPCITIIESRKRYHFVYVALGRPVGQDDTHNPQGCTWRYSLHLVVSKRMLTSSEGSKSIPVNALTGQASTQILHFPHGLSTMSPVVRGASVSTVAKRTRGPKASVSNRQFFPIQPSPAK